nr:MAG TPA: hypothetical protein [Caudoviricetes sp.]
MTLFDPFSMWYNRIIKVYQNADCRAVIGAFSVITEVRMVTKYVDRTT